MSLFGGLSKKSLQINYEHAIQACCDWLEKYVKLEKELARERAKTAKLREALEKIRDYKGGHISGAVESQRIAKTFLAAEEGGV